MDRGRVSVGRISQTAVRRGRRVTGAWRRRHRGIARTASADLGTPFMPPVGLFLVSTTAMGDKGGSLCQIHAREGNGRGSGRPRRQIATRGPRDATPPSSPGPPAATAPARSGRRTRALGGGGRPDGDPRGDDAHLGSSPVHPCLRSVLAPRRVRSVHRPRLRAAGEDLEVSPVSDRTF